MLFGLDTLYIPDPLLPLATNYLIKNKQFFVVEVR